VYVVWGLVRRFVCVWSTQDVRARSLLLSWSSAAFEAVATGRHRTRNEKTRSEEEFRVPKLKKQKK